MAQSFGVSGLAGSFGFSTGVLERAEPRLPRTVEISARQGAEAMTIQFVARAAAQFIAADALVRGYGFIHEIVGKYCAAGSLDGVPLESEGYGVFEYVT